MSLDAQILYALRSADDRGVSGADLSQALGVSRAAVWARVEALRELGYDISASPHHGYRLLASPDLLHADDLLSRLVRPGVIGRDVQVFEQTTSTNDVVEKLALAGVAEGVAVFAESQTKGRGRLGRLWLSPPHKGLWFSVLLRPSLPPQQATQLTVMSAIALRRAIHAHCGLSPEIKWPNDLLLGGRKVAGILTELYAEPDQIKYAILGIGVDVNLEAEDFPPDVRAQATSLRLELGRHVPRAALAVAILRELDTDYMRLLAGRFAEVADEWEQYCTTLGRNVRLQVGDRKLRGRAEALDDDGALLLRTDYGLLERVIGGDLILEK
jgi:BirA family biotin operon repressor/biotin-[acetyl-CoA-carboxylase] ligase